jgi:SAM-dependent methyltransferase
MVHFTRRVLQFLDRRLSAYDMDPEPAVNVPPDSGYDEIVAFLRSLDQLSDGAGGYLNIHLRRLARTLTLVPPPGRTGRVLELGSYLQITAALGCVLGYKEVRGAYYGEAGIVDEKSVTAAGKTIFCCAIDRFDAEVDRFPYPDGSFDCVLACEIIEHLLLDPMHMLIEIHRVLDERGSLVLTTPNVASFTAVLRILGGRENPQVYSMYPNPKNPDRRSERPHVREYTPHELEIAVRSAGFEIEYLFTENIEAYTAEQWMRTFLRKHHFPVIHRGEQLYMVARKSSAVPIDRYPAFLYEPN